MLPQEHQIQPPFPFFFLPLAALIQNSHVAAPLLCVHIHLFSSDWERLCECWNISVKLLCALLVYLCLSSGNLLIFFCKNFSFSFLFFSLQIYLVQKYNVILLKPGRAAAARYSGFLTAMYSQYQLHCHNFFFYNPCKSWNVHVLQNTFSLFLFLWYPYFCVFFFHIVFLSMEVFLRPKTWSIFSSIDDSSQLISILSILCCHVKIPHR